MSFSFLGVDPGAGGGMALLHGKNHEHLRVDMTAMPKTERDVWEWLRERADHPDRHAVIEKVSGFIGTPHPGSAMFVFGMSTGGLRMALTGLDFPFEDVTPQRWQKALGIPTKKKHDKVRRVQIKKGKDKGKWKSEKFGGETGSMFKQRLRAFAQRLYPKEKITLATADAILIATYCMRKYEGRL